MADPETWTIRCSSHEETFKIDSCLKREVEDTSNLSQDFLEPETELQSPDFAGEQAKFVQVFSVLSWNLQEVQLVLGSNFQKVQLLN